MTYAEAGCFDSEAAHALEAAGIAPDEAATRTDESVGLGCYEGTIGYKVANNDLSVEEAKAFLVGEAG